MNIICNACGNKLEVVRMTVFDDTYINPCKNCLKLAKLELIEDIEDGRITLDENWK